MKVTLYVNFWRCMYFCFRMVFLNCLLIGLDKIVLLGAFPDFYYP